MWGFFMQASPKLDPDLLRYTFPKATHFQVFTVNLFSITSTSPDKNRRWTPALCGKWPETHQCSFSWGTAWPGPGSRNVEEKHVQWIYGLDWPIFDMHLDFLKVGRDIFCSEMQPIYLPSLGLIKKVQPCISHQGIVQRALTSFPKLFTAWLTNMYLHWFF